MAEVKENKGNSFKYILIFIVFLAAGAVIGVYGATNYLNKQDEEKIETPETIKDITDDSVYQNTINDLYNIVNNNVIFYSAKGVNIASLDNNSKLSLIYEYVVNNNLYEKTTLSNDGTGKCSYGFILDSSAETNIPSIVCTVYEIKKADIKNIAKKLYNDDSISIVDSFMPEENKSCVLSNDKYVCGNTGTSASGALEIKFDIQKVTLDLDGTIEIYDKGYLADRRAGVDDPNDQYDNYYLHSSDSNEYYYELKSADNITFKHTFKTDDKTNYYYVSTEISND